MEGSVEGSGDQSVEASVEDSVRTLAFGRWSRPLERTTGEDTGEDHRNRPSGTTTGEDMEV